MEKLKLYYLSYNCNNETIEYTFIEAENDKVAKGKVKLFIKEEPFVTEAIKFYKIGEEINLKVNK